MNRSIVSDWYILSFLDALDTRIVYACIKYDSANRFYPGDWVATSPIVMMSGNVFITRNTRYTLEGTGFYLTLQSRKLSLAFFVLGFSPAEVLAI